jgi:heat shock protein HslJ
MQTAGDPASTEQPGGPNVQHTEFVLYNGTEVPQDYFSGVGSIHVYNTADFAGYLQAGQEYQNLQNLLSQHPDLTQYMVPDTGTNANNLPYLPGVGAAQAIRARANYIDTPSLSGVTYLTVFRQDVSPFTGSEFLYTFQGISKDGAHYVSAIFTLNTGLFPATIPADFDENAFGATLNDYMTQSIATLNGAQPTDFTPSLTDLDAMVQSFSFAGTPVVNPPPVAVTLPPPVVPTLVPTQVNTDPTLGGLANKTWTLVSYGDPANPTPVVEGGQPVTLVFSATGVSGNGSCNSYGGSFQYDSSAGTISFSQIISTLIACDQPINDQERVYFDALSKATNYVITGNQLQITYDGGVLTFNGA